MNLDGSAKDVIHLSDASDSAEYLDMLQGEEEGKPHGESATCSTPATSTSTSTSTVSQQLSVHISVGDWEKRCGQTASLQGGQAPPPGAPTFLAAPKAGGTSTPSKGSESRANTTATVVTGGNGRTTKATNVGGAGGADDDDEDKKPLRQKQDRSKSIGCLYGDPGNPKKAKAMPSGAYIHTHPHTHTHTLTCAHPFNRSHACTN